jgi:hypothetical protein
MSRHEPPSTDVGSAVPRKFTLIDAMVLVAAAAVSLVLIREYIASGSSRHIVESIPRDWSFASIWRFGTLLSGMLAPLAVSLSLALWVLRLRRPRPEWRELFSQPGTIACTATIAESGLIVVKVWLSQAYLLKRSLPLPDLHHLWINRLPWNGEVVAVAWLVLWLCGSWRSEPGWIDRAGRVLGVYWIISGVLFHYMMPY